jgi:hypothetical protein
MSRRSLVLTTESARHPFRASLPPRVFAVPRHEDEVLVRNEARENEPEPSSGIMQPVLLGKRAKEILKKPLGPKQTKEPLGSLAWIIPDREARQDIKSVAIICAFGLVFGLLQL